MTPPPYRVRRSDRARHARLTVDDDGGAVVVLPRRMPVAVAATLVEAHADWLERHMSAARAERARLDARPPIGEGRVLPVAGCVYRVSAVDGRHLRPPRGRVEERPASDGREGLLVVRIGRDGRAVATVLEGWLRARAADVIGDRVALHAAAMGSRPGRVTIRDQRSRWASASTSGALSFSWRLVLAPPHVLDAVVVHELAHLRIRGHGRAFWTLVERHAPQTRDARRWLREHARDLRAALD